MTYVCLGNDQYEITLTVFRDCYNGEPPFDNPAAIGIFDADNELLFFELIDFNPMVNDTLDPVLSDDCFVAPPNVCVHRTIYQTVINLPPIAGGYQLAYQRCCRNVTIANLIEPLDVGATFGVTISETALDECDSSPVYNFFPPIFICVNEPISFDQSASDLDGDSIVYSLCTPLSGVTPDNPVPQPPNAPPYPDIPWLDPPYNVDNMLNGLPGGIPLAINSQTGLLTGTPNTIGQFVVGVCAEAYRDGQVISTIRRDFQYNVGICGVATAAFFSPEIQCDNLTVSFENQSELADDFIWIFGDENNPLDTSTLENPVFTYSDTGTYTITLIAEPNSSCVDTTTAEITLLPDSIVPEFEFEFTECSDSMVISVTDFTTDSASEIIEWSWELVGSLGEILDTSSLQNPVFVVDASNQVTLIMTVTAANGCMKVYQEEFSVDLLEEELIADTLQLCLGESVNLNPPPFITGAIYEWSPAATLNGADFFNPIATPLETTTYTVTITDGNCQIQRSVMVIVPDPVEAAAPNDTITCEAIINLTAETNFGTQFFWATDPDFDNVVSEEQSFEIELFGEQTFYLMVRDTIGCSAFDTVTIVSNGVNAAIDPDTLICIDESINLMLLNTDPNDILTFSWSPDSVIFAGQGTSTITYDPNIGGIQNFYVETENQHGCTRIDSTFVGVIDTTAQADFIFTQQCDGFSIQFTNTSVNAPFYLWDFGDNTNPNDTSTATNPTYIYPQEGSYFVTLTLPGSVNCPDTIIQTVPVGSPMIEVDFSYEITECSDSIIIQFTNESINNQSDFTAFNWQFSDGQSSDLENPLMVFNENQLLEVLFEITSSDGCMDTLSQIIPIELITVNLADTLLICPGLQTPLNPNPNTEYEYIWSPSTGLNNPNLPNPLASPTETTTYSVTITNDANVPCEIIREVTAVVQPDIDLFLPSDTAICASELEITAISPDAVSIQWSTSPDFVTVFSQDFTTTVNPSGMTPYFVQVESEFGCFQTDTITITNGTINVGLQGLVEVCNGDTVRLPVENLNPNDGSVYSWSPISEILEGENTNNPLVNPIENTTFSVEIINDFGCMTTETVEVIVNDFTPLLQIVPPVDTIFLGDTIQLTATFDQDYQYFWSPNNTLDFPFSNHNPLAFPSETTTYELVIRDENGCSNEEETTLFVFIRSCIDPFIFVPSGFSPNNDGKNDYAEVFGNNIESMEFFIYNRWGEKVFESFSQDIRWDGTINGEPMPPDVYGYYLNVNCVGGETFFKKGNITLVR